MNHWLELIIMAIGEGEDNKRAVPNMGDRSIRGKVSRREVLILCVGVAV